MNRQATSILRLVRPVLDDDLCRVGRSYGHVEPYGGDQAGAVLSLAAARASPNPDTAVISGRGLLREIASRPGRRVTAWLARADDAADRAVGLISLVAAGQSGPVRHSIGWLLVDPDHRRRGVGTALVHVALAEARRGGATEVWVETHAAWPAATAFWQRLGFMPR